MATKAERDRYDPWVTFHATAIGVPGDVEPRTAANWTAVLRRWLDTFIAAGYTLDELTAASRSLIRSAKVPRFTGEHLEALNGFIRNGRALALLRDSDRRAEQLGICCTCDNAGWVTVPHPAGVKDGKWEWVRPYRHHSTTAVACSCALGHWVRSRNSREVLTLDAYEAKNPRWREQLELHRRERDERAAVAVSDPAWDRLRNALRERLAVLQGGGAWEGLSDGTDARAPF